MIIVQEDREGEPDRALELLLGFKCVMTVIEYHLKSRLFSFLVFSYASDAVLCKVFTFSPYTSLPRPLPGLIWLIHSPD